MRSSQHPVVIVGGGQSGLAAAHTVRTHGLNPVVIEATAHPAGSWPRYYDSLRLFSPARYSGLPGLPFPGDPDAYPRRDEVVAYLRRYAAGLDVEIRTGVRVDSVTRHGDGFLLHTAGGAPIPAAALIAASGSFGNPYLPRLPGQDDFPGDLRHVADYRDPQRYAGQRVIVVGAGNSAVQVGHELARIASVTLATRAPIRFVAARILGRDPHFWTGVTGFDRLPTRFLTRLVRGTPVLDVGGYAAALNSGRPDRRPMFAAFDGDRVVWPDGHRERVDSVIFATGYRPDLGYLRDLGALDPVGRPRHAAGLSTTHPHLGYLGLEFQRSFASNTLRGVGRDAAYVVARLVGQDDSGGPVKAAQG